MWGVHVQSAGAESVFETLVHPKFEVGRVWVVDCFFDTYTNTYVCLTVILLLSFCLSLSKEHNHALLSQHVCYIAVQMCMMVALSNNKFTFSEYDDDDDDDFGGGK